MTRTGRPMAALPGAAVLLGAVPSNAPAGHPPGTGDAGTPGRGNVEVGIVESVAISGSVRWGTTPASPDATYLSGVTVSLRGNRESDSR